MSLKSINKLDNGRCEVYVEVDSKTFLEAINKVYQKEAKRFNLPGFRRGKVPLTFIEKQYGEKIFFNDAISYLYPDALRQALIEANIELIEDKIDFDLISADKNSGIVFKSTLTTKPDVQIEGYKELKIKEFSSRITEKDIKKEIEAAAEQNARLITVEDKAAELGDIVVIDFEGFVDNKAFDDGKSENFSLKLGNQQFIEGFEEAIVGHKSGEEFNINVTFPKNYPIENLRKKPAVFKVKIHKIQIQEIPKIDDEFAKDISEFETLKEYKNSLKENLKKEKEAEARNKTEEQIMKKLSSIVKIDLPKVMVDRKTKEISKNFKDHLISKGLDMNIYLKYNGLTEEQVEEDFRKTAEIKIKSDLAIEKIAKIEHIVVTNDDVRKKCEALAGFSDINKKNIESMSKNPEFLRDIIFDKTFRFLIENSKKLAKLKKNTSN